MSKELKNLIVSLSESNFKTVIKEFIKEKYKTVHVRIIDGPYDGGNDIEILVGGKEIRRNIQVTVQKTGYEKKLDEDLEKSKKNVDKYNYLKNLDFYISQEITKKKRNELELHAELDFGITLTIYDANILSQEADTYNSIREFVYKSHNIKNGGFKIADKQMKILFDVLTLDQHTIDIKKNFIDSYIFSFLFTNPNSSIDQIYSYINPHLNNSLNKEYLLKELNYLRTKKQLESPSDKNIYFLSEPKFRQLHEVMEISSQQEKYLKKTIEDYIVSNGIKCDCDELIKFIFDLYRENYLIDIAEIKYANNSYENSLKKIYNDLKTYFIKIGVDEKLVDSLVKTLLALCESNEFLNKLATIHLFNNLYSSDKLEKYISSKVQTLFLDTQILIRLICVVHFENLEFRDTALQSVKLFYSIIEQYKQKISLYTSYDYINEVAGHLYEAVKLQRLLDIPIFSKIGKSKNVFYNAFLEYKDFINDEEYFLEDYINELIGEDIFELPESEFISIASRKFADIFDLLGLDLIYHTNYSNYATIKKEYETSLSYHSRKRSYIALENDLRTILYLASKENHLNEETEEFNEPFLVTWDSAFYSFRKELLANHKELSYWYIYTPLKVVDRLSVMNFQLNPRSISLNIIALTESNFNYSSKNATFLDVLSGFFSTKDVSNLAIIQKLAKLKESTRNINETPSYTDFTETDESDRVTNLLLDVKNYYCSSKSNYKFDDIIDVFTIPEYEDQIISIFENMIPLSVSNEIMFSQFDNLIAKIKTPTK